MPKHQERALGNLKGIFTSKGGLQRAQGNYSDIEEGKHYQGSPC